MKKPKDLFPPDGAYKLPSGWRVVEQWQVGDRSRLIASLVPVSQQEKVEGIASHYIPSLQSVSQVNTTASDKTGEPITADQILDVARKLDDMPKLGFEIILMESIAIQDGRPVLMLSPKDYKEYASQFRGR